MTEEADEMVEVEEAEGQQTESESFQDDSTEDEVAEAKALGWKPPSDWKGDPPKNGFQTAREYIERGKTVLPIIRSQNAKLEKDLAEANKKLEDFKAEQAKMFENLQRMSNTALKRQREMLEAKYDASIQAAAEVGDKDAVKQLRKEEREALKEFDEAVSDKSDNKDKGKEKTNDLPPDVAAILRAWQDENAWFDDDEDMRLVATNYHGKLLRERQDLSLTENLKRVRDYVAKRFPASFKDEGDEEPAKRKGSPVEGAGSRMNGGGTRSAWSRLPVEAQKQADRFIEEDGLFLERGETAEKDRQKARERYAREYFGEDK